jgi:hypothetical protein
MSAHTNGYAPHAPQSSPDREEEGPEELVDPTRLLSLNQWTGVRIRESTMASADDAAGIFDLYGTSRDSWAPSGHVAGERRASIGRVDGQASEHANANGNARVSRPSPLAGNAEAERGVEELVPPSPMSWSGPMEAMANREHRLSTGSSSFPSARVRDSMTPDITVTADCMPSKRDLRNSTHSSSTSATTPTHPSMSRLSPSPMQTAGPGMNAGAGASQVSFGSSQYPGEEADAFYVRSTCTSHFVPLFGLGNIADLFQTPGSKQKAFMAMGGTQAWSALEVDRAWASGRR